MKIGEVFRYARPYSPKDEYIDGLPNYFFITHSKGHNLPLLESGINPIKKVSSPSGLRCPAILISSSPHKIGSAETPWQDTFDPDNGHIHYYGDNKSPGTDPAMSLGNRALLEEFNKHSSIELKDRRNACPIIFFKRVRVGNRSKGNVQFQGFGIIESARVVTQYDRRNDHSFSNYVFDFVVFSQTKENEVFHWDWIFSRRNSALTDAKTIINAPASWKAWVRNGKRGLEQCRRRIIKTLVYSTAEQQPSSPQELSILKEIYSFYSDRKTRFEALASFVAGRVLNAYGHSYRSGWITSASSDGGADFIGRLDIGSGLARVKMVVLGQAKCEKYDKATGGNHIARTVARLRRGWIGVYVTTSYFSEPVQREVLADKYPIMLIHGHRIATELMEVMYEDGITKVEDLLNQIDSTYEDQLMSRDPEEILYD